MLERIRKMCALKTAWELASERIIASKYKKEVFRDEENEPVEFVTDFEFPGTKDEEGEFSKDFIEKSQTQFGGNKQKPQEPNSEVNETGEIKVMQPESHTFHDLNLEVILNGNFTGYLGFDRVNRVIAFGLSNRNVKVKIEIEKYLNHINKSTREQLNILEKTEVSPDAPKIWGVTMPLNLSHTGKKIVYTMIETSEKAHKDYSGKLNLADEVWVPTNYGKQVLANRDIHIPDFVRPLGVDPSRYNEKAGIMDFGQVMRSFKFLSVFRWSYRKGFDLLLRAYLEEFNSSDDVSLLMVSRSVECLEDVGVQKIVEDFNAIKSSVNKSEEDLPHIALYTKPIRESVMPRVYGSCNAYVSLSRGEGFNLPIVEAASVGLPVIATNVTAHKDYLKPDNSFLIEPEGYVTANINGELSRMAKLCRFYEGQIFPNFHNKSLQQIREAMRYVYENYGEAEKRAKRLQSFIQNNYTWDMAVDRVYNRLVQVHKEKL